MASVVLERDGMKVNAELKVEELMKLMGLDNSVLRPAAPAAQPKHLSYTQQAESVNGTGGYEQFLRDLSDRGRTFVRILDEHRDGIDAMDLATKLGYNDAKQVGGLTGCGLATMREKAEVEQQDVYRTEVTNPNGVRILKFYPGKLILKKPA